MKAITRISLVLFIASLFVFSGCGKYEEGPSISLASKKSRMMGVWKYDKIISDGEEEELSDEDKNYRLTIEDGTWSDTDGTTDGTWTFNDDKTKAIFTASGFSIELDILKLKSKELWTKFTLEIAGSTSSEETHYVAE